MLSDLQHSAIKWTAILSLLLVAGVVSAAEGEAEAGAEGGDDTGVSFSADIVPIFEAKCTECHGGERPKARVDLTTYDAVMLGKAPHPRRGGDPEAMVLPGEPDKSPTYTLTILDPEDGDIMPPKKKFEPLSKEQTELIRLWILQGAKNN